MNVGLNERKTAMASLLLLGGCVLWATWPALAAMADRWARDPRYAHGYFVPAFALALLWMRRSLVKEVEPRGSTWGLVAVIMGSALQLAGGYYRIEWFAGLALLPYLAGLAMVFGGWRFLGWAWPSIAFLAFMVPLPWRIETAVGPPLQYLATTASTYVLQTLGLMAFAEGFVIQVNDNKIGVVEACNGLSMLMTFIALSTAMAMVVTRPLLDRLVLIASSVPVALLANIFRIVLTGVLHEAVGGHASSTFYHDLAGWVMMPMALALYWIEIRLLSRLLIEVGDGAGAPPALLEARLAACRPPRRDGPESIDPLICGLGTAEARQETLTRWKTIQYEARTASTQWIAPPGPRGGRVRPGGPGRSGRAGATGGLLQPRAVVLDNAEGPAEGVAPSIGAGPGPGDRRRRDRRSRGLVPRPPRVSEAEARLHVAAQPPKVLFQTVETQNAGRRLRAIPEHAEDPGQEPPRALGRAERSQGGPIPRWSASRSIPSHGSRRSSRSSSSRAPR